MFHQGNAELAIPGESASALGGRASVGAVGPTGNPPDPLREPSEDALPTVHGCDCSQLDLLVTGGMAGHGLCTSSHHELLQLNPYGSSWIEPHRPLDLQSDWGEPISNSLGAVRRVPETVAEFSVAEMWIAVRASGRRRPNLDWRQRRAIQCGLGRAGLYARRQQRPPTCARYETSGRRC